MHSLVVHLQLPVKGALTVVRIKVKRSFYTIKYIGEEILNAYNCCTLSIQCATANTRKETSVQY